MSQPTQPTKTYVNISWRYPTQHSADGRQPEAELAVKNHFADQNLDSRGVKAAVIK